MGTLRQRFVDTYPLEPYQLFDIKNVLRHESIRQGKGSWENARGQHEFNRLPCDDRANARLEKGDPASSIFVRLYHPMGSSQQFS
jgi:hypothetical protein